MAEVGRPALVPARLAVPVNRAFIRNRLWSLFDSFQTCHSQYDFKSPHLASWLRATQILFKESFDGIHAVKVVLLARDRELWEKVAS